MASICNCLPVVAFINEIICAPFCSSCCCTTRSAGEVRENLNLAFWVSAAPWGEVGGGGRGGRQPDQPPCRGDQPSMMMMMMMMVAMPATPDKYANAGSVGIG